MSAIVHAKKRPMKCEKYTAGFHARVRSESDTSITFTHCMIHREALVAKKNFPDLNAVVQDAVKVFNFIKSRAFNTGIFAILCGEMESEFATLLLHCEVRWLLKAKALKNEVVIFLMEKIQIWSTIFAMTAGF